MKILVTCKRVADPDARIRVRADGSGIETAGLEYKPNPFDENAIEEALRIKEAQGAEVVVVGVGPEDIDSTIRTFLAMGADRAIRIDGLTDDELDSDLTARIFAAVFRTESPDLFIMGKQAVDGDSNQVAQLTAEYLGLPQACFASKVELLDGKARVTREVDGGLETIDIDLPGIISADLRLNEPRYPGLMGIRRARRKELKVVPVADLEVDTALKVEHFHFEPPPERKGQCTIVETVDELIDKLRNEAKVI